MPDVNQTLLVRLLQDVIDARREVVITDLVPAEVPERALVVVWVQAGVFPGVGGSPGVSHPDVVSLLRQEQAQALVDSVEDEAGGAAEEAVHEEDDGPASRGIREAVGDAVEGQDVAVFGGDFVGFGGVAVQLDEFFLWEQQVLRNGGLGSMFMSRCICKPVKFVNKIDRS